MSTTDARLDALEARIAHQDRAIEDLDATITEQWKIIDELRRRLDSTEEQVRSGAFIADPASDKPPPHY